MWGGNMKNLKDRKVLLITFMSILCFCLFYHITKAEDKCPYHQVHTEECGYVETIEGKDCQHEHDETCYGRELICRGNEHTHNEGCYDENHELICGFSEHVHDDNCYEDILNCHHQHDDNCGYVEEIKGQSCAHRCSYCDKELVRKAKLDVEVKDNQYTLHVESTLKGTKGEDQVYFYLKMNKDLLSQTNLIKTDNHYQIVCVDDTKIQFEPIYFSDDYENVYLKYQQSYDSNKSYIIDVNTTEKGSEISLTTASNFDETEQTELDSITLGKVNPLQSLVVPLAVEANEKEFKNWINYVDVEYRDYNNGYPWEEWKDVTNTTKVDVNDQLRFKIHYTVPGGELSAEKNTIVYQLPGDITFSKEDRGVVLNETGQEVGTYVISTDGKISITFNENYVKNNEKGQSIQGFISFETTVKELGGSEGNKIELPFNDRVTVEIPVDDNIAINEDLNVTKNATVISNDEGIVKYTIVVTSQNGTNSDVNLNDIMTNISYDDNFKVVDENGNQILFTINKGQSNISLQLPQMNAGDKYIITYTAKLDKNLYNGTITAKNKVNANSTDKNGEKIEDSTEVDTDFIKNLISKSGTLSESGDRIIWTIVINESKQDIGGWILTDTFNEGELPPDTVLHISPKIDESDTITLPHTFAPGTKETYTITYETSADKLPGNSNTYNTATLKPENGGEIGSGNIGVGDGKWYNPLQKIADDLVIQDDKTALITWTVNISATEGEIKANWYYEDYLQNDQWFTEQQKQEIVNNIAAALAGKQMEYTVSFKPETGKCNNFRIDFETPLPKGESFSFQYHSTAPLGDETSNKTFVNKGNLNNIVWIDSQIQYKPVVHKFDQKDSGDKTEHNFDELDNGVMKWQFNVNIPKKYCDGNIIITEKLPQGVSILDRWGLEILAEEVFGATEFKFTGNEGKAINDEYTITAVKHEDNSIVITIPKELVHAVNEKSKGFRFVVKAKINDDFIWEGEGPIHVVQFKNEVIVETESKTEIGRDDQTQEITKDDNYYAVGKSAGEIKNNIIPYSLVINPDNKDLLEGADHLILKDVLKYEYYMSSPRNITLVPDSVRVYERNENGTKGNELPKEDYPYTYKEERNESYGQIKAENILSITIPDSKALIVEYKYKVNGEKHLYTEVTNTANLEGITRDSEHNSEKVIAEITDSAAGATIKGIIIYKVDEENTGLGLAGAEFNLYRYDGTQYIMVTNKDDSTKFVTEADGKLNTGELAYNTAYKLVEIKAPEGYLKNEEEYEFMIVHNDKTEFPESKPSGFSGEMKIDGDIIYYTNKKNQTEIIVKKKWFNIENIQIEMNDLEKVQFELWQKIEPKDGELKFDDKLYRSKLYEILKSEEWVTCINDLPLNGIEIVNGKEIEVKYSYYVKELKLPGFETDYINNGGINEGKIQIKNTMNLVLPETGGIGTIPYVVMGLSMMSIGIALFRKRHIF